MNFTLETYKRILNCFIEKNREFVYFTSLWKKSNKKEIVLRHDVDRLPVNALKMAKLENILGLKSTYYFRIVDQVFKPEIILEIMALGHEIGYHYEDLTLAKGNIPKAIESFEKNLDKFRQITDVKTICMHGSPLTKWDNREIWKETNYRKYGIILEPYFDVDYNEYFYITDTGRKWNQTDINIRDKVNSGFDIPIKSTKHLISLIENDQLPPKIIINTHPQRWFDPGILWLRELAFQNAKNVAKYGLNLIRK